MALMTRISTALSVLTGRSDRASLHLYGAGDGGMVLGGDSLAGPAVNPESALALSAVWRALNITGEAIGKLPLVLYRRTEQDNGLPGRDRLDRNSVARMLAVRPNPEMTAFSFWSGLVMLSRQWGNGYAEIQLDDRGRPAALWPIHPTRVTAARRQIEGREVLGYWVHLTAAETSIAVTDAGGDPGRSQRGRVWIDADSMFSLPNTTFNMITGISTIAAARANLSLAVAAENYGASFFGNSGRPSGILVHPATLSPEAAKRIKESWGTANGRGNSQGTPVLEEGVEYKAISMPPEDAQFIETRRLQIQDIARWFGVPLHKLMDMGGATFSNIEHQAAEFREDTVLPMARKIEQEIDYKILRRLERGRLFARFDLDALVVPSATERADYLLKMRQGGFINADEGRVRENLTPMPGSQGQGVWHPVNMATVLADGSAMLPYRPAETIETDASGNPDPKKLPGATPAPVEPSDEVGDRAGVPELSESPASAGEMGASEARAGADGAAVLDMKPTEPDGPAWAALRPVFGDVFERMATREDRAKAAKKDPDAAWLDGWRGKHTEWTAAQLLAPVRAALAAQGVAEGRDTDDGTAIELAAGVAAEWCESITLEPRQDGEAHRLVGAALEAVKVDAWTL
jgi:HK97 family phage portal protein